MAPINTQMHTIRIKNEYPQSQSRSYSVLAEPPRIAGVNDLTIKQPELSMSVFHKTRPISAKSQTVVFFTMDYFGFIGELTNLPKGQRVDLTTWEAVKLGDAKNNGSTLQASFAKDEGAQMSVDSRAFSRHGTFTIQCLEPPPDGKKYVVGLAQHLVDVNTSVAHDSDNEREEQPNPIPIAAVPYQQGRVYRIKPANRMCIRTSNEMNGQVLAGDKVVFPVDFPQNVHELLIVENTDGKFRYHRDNKKIQDQTIHNLLLSDHPLPSQYHPAQAAAPRHVGKDMQKVLDAGFDTRRQLKAYEFLCKYNQNELSGFYDEAALRKIALHANSWGELVSKNDNLSCDMMDDLLVLALYDCILFLDNSKSMDHERERVEQLMDICANIVDVESIYENTANVKIEFLNGKRRLQEVLTADAARNLVDSVTNHGLTPIGTELKRKILDQFVYNRLASKEEFRPIILSIITDGKPEGESPGELKKQIRDCKEKLKEQKLKDGRKLGEKHVLFQISRVGQDKSAINFLKSLKEDKDLQRILHCTSYMNLDIDPETDETILGYAPAIQRLAGAAFIGLKRTPEEEWEAAGVAGKAT